MNRIWTLVGPLALAILAGCASDRFDTLDLLNQQTYIVFYTTHMAQSQSSTELTAAVDAYNPAAIYIGSDAGWTRVYALSQPADNADATITSRDHGLVHITVANDPRTLTSPLARTELSSAIANSRLPWRLLLVARPVVNAAIAPGAVENVRLFERLGLACVIAPGGESYVRTEPIGAGPAGAVRYITLPTLPNPMPQMCPWRPWMARTLAAPRYAVLDATMTRLRWSLYDDKGRLLDLLEIRRDNTKTQPARTRTISEVLALSRYQENNP